MDETDLRDVFEISKGIHRDYPESLPVLREKRALFGMGCFVLGGEEGGLLGYCFSHPWRQGSAPSLNTPLGAIPGHPMFISFMTSH